MQNDSHDSLSAKAVIKTFTVMFCILAAALVVIALIAASWVMRGVAS